MIGDMKTLCVLLLLGLAPATFASGLSDRIWSTEAERFIEPGELESVIATADIVLLGEIHDRADHHERQARMIGWAARDRRPGIVLEMVGPEHADILADWHAEESPDPATLGPALSWAERGWPDWSIYEPIAVAALDHDLRFHPGAPDPSVFRQVVRAGLEAVDSGIRERMALNHALAEPARARLLERLDQAHCGLDEHLPVERMLDAQRLRDAAMAQQLVAVRARAGSAVLVAGSGHVRRDYGVPHYLGHLADGLDVVSIGLVPVADRVSDAAGKPHYPAFDHVWFSEGSAQRPECDDEA